MCLHQAATHRAKTAAGQTGSTTNQTVACHQTAASQAEWASAAYPASRKAP
eukprot:CAMPEP_0177668782 /NCGR_PEP_ID=MMETSP0447-20121125/23003_1 /TAXON_ID=0 /ORGANISM="Stygamoeba regulata, Strain BSH-02190019" /LENGTH=50 /DNA_ID=CAMNT_0019175429 /DNA_START=133 /DNA_END=282 /DNA_ORIENTATION=-